MQTRLIEAARAHAEQTTLDAEFQRWLSEHATAHERLRGAEDAMAVVRDLQENIGT